MVLKILGTRYVDGFSVELTNGGGLGGVVDVPPTDGIYAGIATAYPQTISTITNTLNGEEFELIDEVYLAQTGEERFTLLCRLEDSLSGNNKFVFRDHRDHELIMLDGLNLPEEMISNMTGRLELSYIKICDIKGVMSIRTSFDSTSILRHTTTAISTGGTCQKTIGEYKVESQGLSVSNFISLGSIEDIIGAGTVVNVSTVVGNRTIHNGMRNCANALLQIDF